jgi:putative polyketide hydroxylase
MSPRESHGRPGTRAPHVWLIRGGERVSSLDAYGRGFVLLCGPAANEWARCAREVSKDLPGFELGILQPGVAGLQDTGDDLAQRHGIATDGCVLIRPDGFVGWRARNSERASTQQLRAALSQLLGQP